MNPSSSFAEKFAAVGLIFNSVAHDYHATDKEEALHLLLPYINLVDHF